MQDMHAHRSVKGTGSERQTGDVTAHQRQVRRFLSRKCREHLRREINADDLATGKGRGQCNTAGANPHFEHPRAAARKASNNRADLPGNFGWMPTQRVVLHCHALIEAKIEVDRGVIHRTAPRIPARPAWRFQARALVAAISGIDALSAFRV